jgi:hypothetical protein
MLSVRFARSIRVRTIVYVFIGAYEICSFVPMINGNKPYCRVNNVRLRVRASTRCTSAYCSARCMSRTINRKSLLIYICAAAENGYVHGTRAHVTFTFQSDERINNRSKSHLNIARVLDLLLQTNMRIRAHARNGRFRRFRGHSNPAQRYSGTGVHYCNLARL